jgi:hypothetical protein
MRRVYRVFGLKSIWSIDGRASPPSVLPSASIKKPPDLIRSFSRTALPPCCSRFNPQEKAIIMAAEQRKLLEQLMGGTSLESEAY